MDQREYSSGNKYPIPRYDIQLKSGHTKFCFTVEVKAVSTPSRSVVLHPLRRAVLSPVLRLRPLSGISILVIPQIM
jgi:hypothetical protein